MKRLFLLDESEKKRILNMHKSSTSRQYLSEQNEDDNFDAILTYVKNELVAASKGLTTDEDKFVKAFKEIPRDMFDEIIEKLMTTEMNGESGLNELIKSEFDRSEPTDIIAMEKLKDILDRRSNKYTIDLTKNKNRYLKNVGIVAKG